MNWKPKTKRIDGHRWYEQQMSIIAQNEIMQEAPDERDN
jgi:hypothetical protein